ncbi:MAG: GspH/FimT family pseudopilin [Gemmobacter sp.]
MTTTPPPRRASDAGLTLFEVLVVMAIIGIASAAAVMGVSALTRDTRAQDEAQRLAAMLQVAGDEALVNGQPLVLEWSAGGYGFRRWLGDGAGWGAAADPRLAAFRALPPDLTLARSDGGDMAVTLAPGGMAAAVALHLDGAGGTWTVAFDGIRAQSLPGRAAP